MNRFKLLLAGLTFSVVLGTIGLTTASSSALVSNPLFAASAGKEDACAALKEIDPANGCGNDGASVNGIIKSVVRILSYIVGFVSVIMVIIGGFKYVTSGGDSGKVSSAKTTLVYALVGLVIVAIAQVIVSFVLKEANGSTVRTSGAIVQSVDTVVRTGHGAGR